MISEVLNALFLTYVATEYHLKSIETRSTSHGYQARVVNGRTFGAAAGTVVVTILDRTSGASAAANKLFQGFLYAPKIFFIIIAYIVALYIDCKRIQRDLITRQFLWALIRAFVQILPFYPLLAVIFSFGCLIVINIFEFLRLPQEMLNWPVYYVTLYGPFSMVYFMVKESYLREKMTLPSIRVR